MGKLIIHHGGRVTEHELLDTPVVIGRDPQCELFFADRKLSRHHARVEREGRRFKLVDLESRNGSWVNEERVDEQVLHSGDNIRLGGLRISFEGELASEPEPPEEATAYLPPSGGSPDDSSTVILGAPVEPRAEATIALTPSSEEPSTADADETSTVILSRAESVTGDYADETLERPPSPESTVVLTGERQGSDHDTGAVLLHAEADPELVPRSPVESDSDVMAGTSAETDPGVETVLRAPAASESDVVHRHKTGSWTLKFALIAASMAVLAFLVFALPLMRTLGDALVEESKLRGRALLDVLAAANESALGESRTEEVSVSRVADEAGVSAAYVADARGGLVAPIGERARAGQPLRIEGVEVDFARLSGLTEAEGANGDYVVAKPITYRDRNVGVAVVQYRLPREGSSWTILVLVLGSSLMAVGVGAAVLVAKRITLSPLKELSEDVARYRDGQASTISVERPYGELEELARNLNDALQNRAGVSQGPSDDAS